MKRGPKPKSAAERFWRFIRKTSGCWLWTGGPKSGGYGYGLFGVTKGKTVQAHCFAYALYHGRIPTGKKVLHKCNVKACVRREHLYVGTNKDNTRDMMEQGRCRWGGAGIKKLSTKQRVSIYEKWRAGASCESLSKELMVSRSTIRHWVSKGVAKYGEERTDPVGPGRPRTKIV